MPLIATEPTRNSEFLISQGNGTISVDELVVAASQDLSPGEIVGIVSNTGRVVAWASGASDGSQTVAGIALEGVVTASGETKRAAILRRDAEVVGAALTYPSGTLATITAGLRALGIIVR